MCHFFYRFLTNCSKLIKCGLINPKKFDFELIVIGYDTSFKIVGSTCNGCHLLGYLASCTTFCSAHHPSLSLQYFADCILQSKVSFAYNIFAQSIADLIDNDDPMVMVIFRITIQIHADPYPIQIREEEQNRY